MEEIPLLAIPNQQVLVTLDGQDCTIHVYQRGDRLYLDLALDGDDLRFGAVCLPGVNIGGEPYPFSGYLIFTDELSDPKKQQPPQYTELGTRYHLYYATNEEAEEIASENVS